VRVTFSPAWAIMDGTGREPGTGRKGAIVDDVLAYIDAHLQETVTRLQAFCRQPSIAAQGTGMADMADMVRHTLAEAGAEAELVPTGGYPVVLGRFRRGSAPAGAGQKTLMFYNHYDVQPPEPLDQWHSPPFAAEIRDGHLYARGVADNKGNLVARLAAVDAWQAVRGGLPLDILFVVEGEEEIGSPHLGFFAEQNRDRLQADGCIWESGYRDSLGRLEILLGVKGILAVDLSLRCVNRDLHSSIAAVIPSAAWRLIWALESLKGPDERVRIAGFYDNVHLPDERDRAMLAAWDYDQVGTLQEFGAEQFLLGLSGGALKEKYLFQPTCNVCGFHSGYGGPGVKTVLPAEARAKLDFRLVPDQDPDEIAELFATHLRSLAPPTVEVEVRTLGTARAAYEDPQAPAVQAAARAYELGFGAPPVYTRGGGSLPIVADFQDTLGATVVLMGLGLPDDQAHAPNEKFHLPNFYRGIESLIHYFALLSQV